MVVLGVSVMVVTVGIVVALTVWFTVHSARRPSAAGPTPHGPSAPRGIWQAMLIPPGTSLLAVLGNRRFGSLYLAGGWMQFIPDGAAEPEWALPLRDVRAEGRSAITLTPGDLTMWLGGGAPWTVAVPDRRLNRWVDNDLKKLRQRRLASEFLRELAHGGAAVT